MTRARHSPLYLAIDFGTTVTVAAGVRPGHDPELVRFGDEAWMPSAVHRCRLNLPQLLEADAHDRAERYDGHAVAAVRLEQGAEFVRGVSTRIEAGRFVLFARNGRGL